MAVMMRLSGAVPAAGSSGHSRLLRHLTLFEHKLLPEAVERLKWSIERIEVGEGQVAAVG